MDCAISNQSRGPVFYWDGKDYQLAFVAAHLTASGTQRLEFCLYDDLSFFQLKPGKGWRRTIQNLMAQSWIGRYFTMRDFHRIVPVEGECALYRYP
uniref:Uncharacterized protein n=1 Tax=Magnetospirillum gryphiswaldense TaxID=55518 RepID=A4TTK5_9PROT|nr:hypothetical protein MGR_1976 [Magnetospirillum gryphiswaldense MSR-1]